MTEPATTYHPATPVGFAVASLPPITPAAAADRLLSTRDLCHALRVSPRQLRELEQRGMPSIALGKRHRYYLPAVRTWLAAQHSPASIAARVDADVKRWLGQRAPGCPSLQRQRAATPRRPAPLPQEATKL